MCFSFLEVGLLGSHWGKTLFDEIVSVRAQSPGQDYFLASHGRPMTYTVALAQFRRCLLCYGDVTADLAQRFTLHSLKTTLLCWANTLGIDPLDRAAQGHHRCAGISGCVPKYGRNDIGPQLRCQRAILTAVDSGWKPGVPLDRGLSFLVADQQPKDDSAVLRDDCIEVSSASEEGDLPESGEDSVASSSAASDSESVAESLDSMEAGYSGPCMVFEYVIRNEAQGNKK